MNTQTIIIMDIVIAISLWIYYAFLNEQPNFIKDYIVMFQCRAYDLTMRVIVFTVINY